MNLKGLAVLFVVGGLLRKAYEYKIAQAWDGAYRTGRTAEREDWNWPAGMKREYLDG